MFCTQCGAAIPLENKFCGACGTPAVIPVKNAANIPTDSSEAVRVHMTAHEQIDAPHVTAPDHPRRPLLISLLAVWQFIKAFFIFVSLAGLALFARGVAELPSPLAVGVTLALLMCLCALAAACGIGLLKLRPYGRTLLLGFACLEVLAFPIGTVIAVLIFLYMRKPEIKSLFLPAAVGKLGVDAPVSRSLIISSSLTVLLVATVFFAAIAILTKVGGQSISQDLDTPTYQPLEVSILGDDGQIIPSVNTVTERHIADINLVEDENGAASVVIHFTAEGAIKMEKLTGHQLGKRIKFAVDGEEYLQHTALIGTVISANASLSFSSMEEAAKFLNILKKPR